MQKFVLTQLLSSIDCQYIQYVNIVAFNSIMKTSSGQSSSTGQNKYELQYIKYFMFIQ